MHKRYSNDFIVPKSCLLLISKHDGVNSHCMDIVKWFSQFRHLVDLFLFDCHNMARNFHFELLFGIFELFLSKHIEPSEYRVGNLGCHLFPDLIHDLIELVSVFGIYFWLDVEGEDHYVVDVSEGGFEVVGDDLGSSEVVGVAPTLPGG